MNLLFRVAIIFCLLPLPVFAEAPAMDFPACVEQFKALAEKQGIAAEKIALLEQAEPLHRVVKADKKQPEFRISFADYINQRVTEARIEKGRQLLKQYQPILKDITEKYGVPGQYLIAFWGLETNYGSYVGNIPVLNALSTLACDPRRSDYFTGELMKALKILAQDNIQADQMRGSWAGAMGYMQFMPTTYLAYAIDGDGDGKVDLWHSAPDALYSAANFLQNLGWQKEQRWGREVMVPRRFDYHQAGLQNNKNLTDWNKEGVRMAVNGKRLPNMDLNASVIVPAGHQGPKFLVYPNFKVIMRWNRSINYALAVAYLADRIVGAGHWMQAPPDNVVQLSKQAMQEIQQKLQQKGFYDGEIDGIAGGQTRQAVRQFQRKHQQIADGFINPWLLKALEITL